MAHIYIRSGATGANNGTSWTDAYTSIFTAFANSPASSKINDYYVVADDHNETQSTDSIIFGNGTGSPAIDGTVIYCANTHTVMPPTGMATTASVTVNATLKLRGRLYIYGITFSAQQVLSESLPTSGGTYYYHVIKLENCKINLTGSTAPGISITPSNVNGAAVLWLENTPIAFNSPNHQIQLYETLFRWVNTNNAVQNLGGGVPSVLFPANGSRFSKIYLQSVDLSGLGANTLMSWSTWDKYVDIRECKLHPSTVLRSSNSVHPVQEFHLFNSDSTASGFRNELSRRGGSRFSETTKRRLAPRRATTGATDYSDRIVTQTNVSFEFPFYTEDYMVHNTAIQSPITVNMYTLTDNVTLTNQDFWIEVEYLGTANSALSSFVSSRRAVIGTAASYPTDTVSTWNTTGITTPVKQTVSVTIEPKIEGSIRIRVFVARPSTTIYLHPRPYLV